MRTEKSYLRLAGILAVSAMLFGTANCNLLGLTDDDDDTTLFAAAFIALNSSSCSSGASTTSQTITNTTATLNGTTGCVNGVSTSMDTALPTWIRNNFKCAVAFVSSTNYCFKATNLPNHRSYYWAGQTAVNAGQSSQYPLFEALPGGNTPAGTNVITQQNFVYTIPSNPTPDTDGTLSSTQGGLSSIGITVNGLAVFNNAAAPGDTLASEVSTFDSTGFGHPESTGIYHHHARPAVVSVDDANLIGIALDGYAIYGKKCDQGTTTMADDATATGLDSLHGHTTVTIHFSTATYHYHLAPDATAGIDTLMGSSFYGNIGSVTN